MSRRRDFPWGRWIRVVDAHQYLGVDKEWFADNIRPHVRVMAISKQARAIPRADIDAVAQRIEDAHGNGPGDEKGVINAWPKREQAASPSMPRAIASSTSKSTEKPSSAGSAPSPRRKPKNGSAQQPSGSG